MKLRSMERCPIGLTFEDPGGDISARLLKKKWVSLWGERNQIALRKQLPQWKMCTRCTSTTHEGGSSCKKPPVCLRCGGKHTFANHDSKCAKCEEEKIEGGVCPHPVSCQHCNGDHLTGDPACPERKKVAAQMRGKQAEQTTTQEGWVQQPAKSRSGA